MWKDQAVKYYLSQYAERIEVCLAALRFLTLVALVTFLYAIGVIAASNMIMLPLVGLSISFLVQLAFALKCKNYRWMPWVVTSVEVGLLALTFVISTRTLGLPVESALNSAGSWLIFIYLVMGVLRLRPELVLFSGGLFLAVWIALAALPGAPSYPGDLAHAADHLGRAAQLSQALRVSIVVILTAALTFSAWFSRRSISEAITASSIRDQMSRHFPKPILDRLLSHDSPAPLYPLNAAVMFVDICGFTKLSESLAPIDVATLIMRFRSGLDEIVQKHGGIIDKFMGDGALVVFGLPEAAEADAARALRCAMDICPHLQQQAVKGKLADLPSIQVGIGVHFGPVLAGVIGDAMRVEFTVLGDTVNVASKLQKAANSRGGGALISEEVATAAGIPRPLWEGVAINIEVPGRLNTVRAIGLTDGLSSFSQTRPVLSDGSQQQGGRRL